MSRKFPKKVRKQYAAKLKAASAFVESWTDSGLASSLAPDYDCTLGCSEADSFADLLRTFGYPNTAETVMADHMEDCDNPHYHETHGVWTFTVTLASGSNHLEVASYTVVTDGKDGAEAESRALDWARKKAHKDIPGLGYAWTRVDDVTPGVPGSTALYQWADLRKAA